ncbi:MAG: DNA/RNA nuclease SfsA [Pseudomonadota bacterium]
MKFAQPLIRGSLIRRYKRFLADIALDDGREITAHCANSGAAMGLSDPGTTVWVEPNDNPKRKLGFTWRLVELGGGHWSGIDTSVPNKVVGEALAARRIPEIAPYSAIRAEVPYGKRSRVDFLARGEGLPDAYIEVKNVHLRREDDWAEFPDCVTTRGARHLEELSDMVAAGHRAIMLYCIQRSDCARIRLASDLDPGYAQAFAKARVAGVEATAWICRLSLAEIVLDRPIPIHVDPT